MLTIDNYTAFIDEIYGVTHIKVLRGKEQIVNGTVDHVRYLIKYKEEWRMYFQRYTLDDFAAIELFVEEFTK